MKKIHMGLLAIVVLVAFASCGKKWQVVNYHALYCGKCKDTLVNDTDAGIVFTFDRQPLLLIQDTAIHIDSLDMSPSGLVHGLDNNSFDGEFFLKVFSGNKEINVKINLVHLPGNAFATNSSYSKLEKKMKDYNKSW